MILYVKCIIRVFLSKIKSFKDVVDELNKLCISYQIDPFSQKELDEAIQADLDARDALYYDQLAKDLMVGLNDAAKAQGHTEEITVEKVGKDGIVKKPNKEEMN